MKGGKDEEVMGPMFPRLHVNDTEKGGPRAPPRNKMALYEQLSVPSQRFNSSASSSLLLQPHNTSTLVPSASSSQRGVHERSVFSPFYIPPPTHSHSVEKVHSHSSDGVNLNTAMVEFERRSVKNASQRRSNVTGHISSTANGSSFRPNDSSNSKNFSGDRFGDEDDFRVPTFVHSEIAMCSNKSNVNRGLTPLFPKYPGHSMVTAANSLQESAEAACNNSSQCHNACDNALKQINTTGIKSRQGKNQGEQKPKETVVIKEHLSGPGHDVTNLCEENARICQESSNGFLPEGNTCDGVSVEPRCMASTGVAEKGSFSRVRSGLDSRGPLGNGYRSSNEAENYNKKSEKMEHGLLLMGDADRNDDVSEASMVDSISGMDISPDDVVGVIGQKHFWKARREIVNQQRVFAVQVFELHRLIKVQKLFAGSPNLLLEDNSDRSKPSPKLPPKKLPSSYSLKSQPQLVKQASSHKSNQNTESQTENAPGKSSGLPADNAVNKGLVSKILNYGSCSFYPSPPPPPPPSVAADNKSNGWCFHQPGNQWLVPVIFPSEGLVYKPYTGPHPPTFGFMAPIYGGCSPLNQDFTSPAYGIPTSHQQEGIGIISGAPNCFPSPYGLPVVNPLISSSAVEQDKQFPTGGANVNMHSRNSCNMSNNKSEAFSHSVWKFPRSKESDGQGSTASSPCDREQGGRDALPLFPTAPAKEDLERAEQPHTSDQQNRVIKVVPHNPRSANESAARIFRFIQEERQQYD